VFVVKLGFEFGSDSVVFGDFGLYLECIEVYLDFN